MLSRGEITDYKYIQPGFNCSIFNRAAYFKRESLIHVPGKITIFLIDDDLDDQEIFQFVMEDVSPDVACVFANDGIRALDKLNSNEKFSPDLIIIDINMPRMNGIQCLQEIKKIKRLKDIPAYMYSTSAEPEMVKQCEKLGAAGFIKKHANTSDIKKEFETLIVRLKA